MSISRLCISSLLSQGCPVLPSMANIRQDNQIALKWPRQRAIWRRSAQLQKNEAPLKSTLSFLPPQNSSIASILLYQSVNYTTHSLSWHFFRFHFHVIRFLFLCISPGSWNKFRGCLDNRTFNSRTCRAPCHHHTDTSTLITISFIHHISSNAIESLPCSWHNLTRTFVKLYIRFTINWSFISDRINSSS